MKKTPARATIAAIPSPPLSSTVAGVDVERLEFALRDTRIMLRMLDQIFSVILDAQDHTGGLEVSTDLWAGLQLIAQDLEQTVGDCDQDIRALTAAAQQGGAR